MLEFERVVKGGELEEALSLYDGEFLAGFHISDAPEFEHWVDEIHDALHGMATRAAQQLTEEAGQHQEAAVAAPRAREWVRLAPYDELAARHLMTASHEMGDRAGALKAHEDLVRRLADLDLVPSVVTESLATTIRDPTGALAPASPLRPLTPDQPTRAVSGTRPLVAATAVITVVVSAVAISRFSGAAADDRPCRSVPSKT